MEIRALLKREWTCMGVKTNEAGTSGCNASGRENSIL
jgi:hypothetical protein